MKVVVIQCLYLGEMRIVDTHVKNSRYEFLNPSYSSTNQVRSKFTNSSGFFLARCSNCLRT